MSGITIFGVTGRMGQTLIRALREAPGEARTGAAAPGPGAALFLSGAVASAASSRLGQDAAADGAATGVTVTADPRLALGGASVAIDFSPAGQRGGECAGLRPGEGALAGGDDRLRCRDAHGARGRGRRDPRVDRAEYQLGVNVAARLVKLAAQALRVRL